MDAMAMALHCVWTTDSFRESVLKCVNMRGDADSVGAVCAQMAGAIYGVSAIPKDWIRQVQRWGKWNCECFCRLALLMDKAGVIDDGLGALRAFKLWSGVHIAPPSLDVVRRLSEADVRAFQFEKSGVAVSSISSKK